MTNVIKRCNNLSLNLTKSMKGEFYFEIVQYYPNPYYGRENEFVKNGDYYKDYRFINTSIHKSCFKNKESCYTVGYFIYDENNGESPDFKSVGSRLSFNDITYQNDFFELINYFYDNELWIENKE